MSTSCLFLAIVCLFCVGQAAHVESVDVIERNDVTRHKRSDDVSLSSLEAVVQQQASVIQQQGSLIQQVQNELTALKQSLPATFAPVAFLVRFSHDSGTGLALSSHAILQFDQVVINIGNGYSPTTGIFRAPYAGLYSFFVKVMAVNKPSHTYMDIVKNGVPEVYAFANGQDTTYDQGFTKAVMHLAVGDEVWVREHTGGAVRGGWYTDFSGVLEQAD